MHLAQYTNDANHENGIMRQWMKRMKQQQQQQQSTACISEYILCRIPVSI